MCSYAGQALAEHIFLLHIQIRVFSEEGHEVAAVYSSHNELAGFTDCSFDRKKKRFVVKEINIQKENAVENAELYRSICSLARFHGADELIIAGEKYSGYQ